MAPAPDQGASPPAGGPHATPSYFQADFDPSSVLTDPDTGREIVGGQVLVRFSSGLDPAQVRARAAAQGYELVGYNAAAGVYQLQAGPDGARLASARQAFADAEIVTYNYILTQSDLYIPNDPALARTRADRSPGAFNPDAWGFERIDAIKIWGNYHVVGRPRIAVLDTGILASHEDLAVNVGAGADLLGSGSPGADPNGHGTHVAGIIGAVGDNGVGLAGMVWDCELIPVRVCDESGRCPMFSILNGIIWAADRGVDVINISAGGDFGAGDAAAEVFDRVVDYARNRGSVVVAAAGRAAPGGSFYPAAAAGAISVGAVNRDDEVQGSSSTGADFYAPGVSIYSTETGGGYGYRDGASMAAAFVSGLAAVLRSADPNISVAAVERAIAQGAKSFGVGERLRVNAHLSLQYILARGRSPAITGVDVPLAAAASAPVTLRAVVADPGGRASIRWTVDHGTLAAPGSATTVWTPPATAAEVRIGLELAAGGELIDRREFLVAVHESELLGLIVEPQSAELAVGQTRVFKAYAVDGGGRLLEVRAVWRSRSGLGLVNAGGEYAALASGSDTLIATLGSLTAEAGIAVTGGWEAGEGRTLASECLSFQCSPSHYHFDPQQLNPPLVERWTLQTGNAVDASIVVRNGVVYAASEDGMLYARDAVTGEEVWTFDSGVLIATTPVIWQDRIFFGTQTGQFYAVDLATGQAIQSAQYECGFYSSPIVVDGLLYIGTTGTMGVGLSKRVLALDANDIETIVWQFFTGGDVYSSPAFYNGVVYVGSANQCIYAFDAADGSLVWDGSPDPQNCPTGGVFAAGSAILSSPTVVDGVLYFGALQPSGRVYAVDAATGQEIWRRATFSDVTATPAVAGDSVFVGSWDFRLWSLDRWTGAVRWRFSTLSTILSSVYVSGNVLYFGSDDSTLYAVDATTGEEIWRYAAVGHIWSSPVVVNGMLYFGGGDGRVYALGAPMAAPENLAAAAGNQQIELAWDPPSQFTDGSPLPPQIIDSYNIYRSTSPVAGFAVIASVAADHTDYLDPGLTNDITYYYHVTALDAAGNESAFSNQAMGTPTTPADLTPPAPPTNLSAIAGDGSVVLNWSGPTQNADGTPLLDLFGYFVYRSETPGGPWTEAMRLHDEPLQDNTYLDADAVNDTTYYYVVTAVDSADPFNESEPSNEVEATPRVELLVCSEWPMFRCVPSNTAFATIEIIPPLIRRWEFLASAVVGTASPVAVRDGVLYTGAKDGNLYALEALTGRNAWAAPFSVHSAINSAPMVHDGKVFFGAGNGFVYALRAGTGALVWERLTGGPIFGSMNYFENLVVFGSWDRNLYALDKDTGAVVWSYPVGAPILSTPAISEGIAYATATDGRIYSVNARTGGLLWNRRLGDGDNLMASPVVVGDRVYVGSDDGHMYAVRYDTGEAVWSFRAGGLITASAAVGHDMVVFGSWDGVVYALDRETGGMLWSRMIGEPIQSSPIIVGSHIFFGADNSVFYALDLDGNEVWRYTAGAKIIASPAASGNMIYVGSNDARIYAFSVSSVPNPPLDLTAAPGDGLVTLTWNPPTLNVDGSRLIDLDGFNVYRSLTQGGPYEMINDELVRTNGYTDTDVVNGVTYYYVVTAVDNEPVPNESIYSGEAWATPFSKAPAPPEDLTATAADARILLEWTAPETNADGSPLTDLAGYFVYRSLVSGQGYVRINQAPVTDTQFVDANVSFGTTYYYVVTAVDHDTPPNESGYSNEAWASPLSIPPGPPTELTAAAGDARVQLGWTAPTANADGSELLDLRGYILYRSAVSGGPYTAIADDLRGVNYLDTDVVNGTAYYYVVTAVDRDGNESEPSNEASATPEPRVPSPPLDLVATAHETYIQLDWTAPTVNTDGSPIIGLTGYKVYRSEESGTGYSVIHAGTVSRNWYRDATALQGVAYYYVVTALDRSSPPNESDYSNEASATLGIIAPVYLAGRWHQYRGTYGDSNWKSAINIGPGAEAVFQRRAFTSIRVMLIPTSSYNDPGRISIYLDDELVETLDLSTLDDDEKFIKPYPIAEDIGGKREWIEVSAVPADGAEPEPPEQPDELTATPGDRKIILTWPAVEGTNVVYDVYRGRMSGYLWKLANNVGATTYTDVPLTNGLTYYYAIQVEMERTVRIVVESGNFAFDGWEMERDGRIQRFDTGELLGQ